MIQVNWLELVLVVFALQFFARIAELLFIYAKNLHYLKHVKQIQLTACPHGFVSRQDCPRCRGK